jgi:hypothetical protein
MCFQNSIPSAIDSIQPELFGQTRWQVRRVQS